MSEPMHDALIDHLRRATAELDRDACFARIIAETTTLGITWTSAACPVEAEGRTRDGLPWYFRARGLYWCFHLAERADADPVDVWWDEPGWLWEEAWGNDPFGASWMSPVDALMLIRRALVRHDAGDLPRAQRRT